MPPATPSHSKSSTIKNLYFYTVSLISLFMIVFATADLVNLGLKTWVFTRADKPDYIQACPMIAPTLPTKDGAIATDSIDQKALCEQNNQQQLEQYQFQKQRDAVRDIAFIVVGIPVFAYHWTTIRKEQREEKKA